MEYESGYASRDDLELYNPDNDWDTHDSAFSILVPPSKIDVSSSICDGTDGNVRARNPKEQERQKLRRHVGDEDGWGSTRDVENPPLGINDITGGKACSRCKLRKRCEYFSPDRRNADGLHSWCKECRKLFTSQQRDKRRSGNSAAADEVEG